jgi:PAS domain S-box-containing protein
VFAGFQHRQAVETFVKTALLAALYYVAGRAGLTMAVPPGYATVFWPSSGLAFAFIYIYGYTLLPGVFAGSFLINYFTYLDVTPAALHGTLVFNALCIALGASLQAFSGVWLVRKIVGAQTRLEKFEDIFKFSFLAGPLSCLIACSTGAGVLFATKTIPQSNVLFTWSTWYAGDTLGVLVFAPVMVLVSCAKDVSRRRKWMVGAPLSLLFLLIVGLFFLVKSWDRSLEFRNFNSEVALARRALENRFESYIFELMALQSFYNASDFIDAKEFNVFAQGAFVRHDDLRSLGWAPLVSRPDLKAFEQRMRQSGNPKYQVSERNAQKKIIPVQPRAEYFPVAYRYSPDIREALTGMDMVSEPARAKAIEQARDTGEATATSATIISMGTPREALGLIVFNPVYKKNMPVTTAEERHRAIDGVLLGLFSYKSIFEPIAKGWEKKGVELQVREEQDDGTVKVLFGDLDDTASINFNTEFYQQEYAAFAGRVWNVEFYRDPQYTLAHINWSIWYTLAGSLAFTFFASAFLLGVTGQTAVVEQLVKLKTRELSDKNNFLSMVMDHVPDMIFVKRRDHTFASINKAMLETMPPSKRGSVLGTTAFDLYPEKDIKGYIEQDVKAFEKGYSETNESYTDYEGTVRTIFTRKIAFLNDAGEQFLLGFARDVTKEKAAEAELKRSNKELEDFAYVASHDLKAPLRHIAMSAGFLKERYKGQFDKKATELLEGMASATVRMQEMIESLLSYSRVGRAKKEFRPVSMGAVVDAVLKALQAQIKEKSAVIEVEGELPSVLGDQSLLTQLMQNLLQNAIKYSKEDMPPRIKISAEKVGALWQISIADNGIGIAPEYAEKVFQIFQRLHLEHEYDGVGIGLAICQRIVEYHGGKTWLDLEYRGGSKFVFTLESA